MFCVRLRWNCKYRPFLAILNLRLTCLQFYEKGFRNICQICLKANKFLVPSPIRHITLLCSLTWPHYRLRSDFLKSIAFLSAKVLFDQVNKLLMPKAILTKSSYIYLILPSILSLIFVYIVLHRIINSSFLLHYTVPSDV